MTAKKKRGGWNKRKKPRGRPKKYDGDSWWDYHETITLSKETKQRLKMLRHKKETSYSATIDTLIEIMTKIGKDYLDMDKPIPQEVLDGIYAMERKNKIERDET